MHDGADVTKIYLITQFATRALTPLLITYKRIGLVFNTVF